MPGKRAKKKALYASLKNLKINRWQGVFQGELWRVLNNPLTRGRFYKSYEKDNSLDGCWNWVANNSGRFSVWRFQFPARMIMWLYASEGAAIPEEAEVCHKCDNAFCVRPDHLFLGFNEAIYTEAALWASLKRRVSPNTKLTEAQVAELRRSPNHWREDAKRLGVKPGAAYNAKYGFSWRSMTEPPPVSRHCTNGTLTIESSV